MSRSKNPEFVSVPESGLFYCAQEEAHFHSFQVIGERCSGTNYLTSLIATNIDLGPNRALGWKHGFPAFVAQPHGHIAIVVVRNAVDWCFSMYRRPWHTAPSMKILTFSEFIRAEWDTVVDEGRHFGLENQKDPRVGMPLQFDRHPISGKRFKNIIQLRNFKNAAWLGLLNREMNIAIVRHEDVREESGAARFVHNLAQAFNLTFKDSFIQPEGEFGWPWSKKRRGEIEVPDQPSVQDKAFILGELELEQEMRFGYSYS